MFAPRYVASVSSVLFPSLNEIAEQTYNPLLSGVGLRPIPTAENPTIQRPLSTMPGEEVQSPSVYIGTNPITYQSVMAPSGSYIQGNTLYTKGAYSPVSASGMNVLPYSTAPQTPTASTQLSNSSVATSSIPSTSSAPPLDMPTVGVETPIELALANTINANEANMQAQISMNQNPIYANMLNSALQKVANQNLQARIAQNYQNNLYLRSLYDVLMQSGMSPAQIISILENQYNAVNSNITNPTSPKPIIADMPYTHSNISRLRQEQQAAALQAALQQIAEYNKTPFIPIVTPMVAFNPQPTLPLQSPIATSPIPAPAITFNPQSTQQSSKASPIPTPSSTPITPFPLLSVNPNVFVENLNPYAGGLPPSLAKTPIVEETTPPVNSGKRTLQLMRMPA